MNKVKELFYALGIIVLVLFYTYKQDVKTIEEYHISSAFGNDIEKIFEDEVAYSVPYSIYGVQKKGENKSYIKEGKESNIGETRVDRGLKSGKLPLVGLQKIIFLSEEQAKFGIKPILNILFLNPKMNDRSLFVVCKGKAVDIMNFKVEGYSSSADFIEGMIKRVGKKDFFIDEYTILNAYVVLDGEGRNLVLPYLELMDNELKVSGMAVFKEDKMMYKLDLEESRVMNILREKKNSGISIIKIDEDKYISYDAKIKRKVKCKKEGERYVFDIEIDCLANIISSKDSKDLNFNIKKELEKLIKKDWEQEFLAFIHNMQNKYKIDMLQLGFIASSKYGKDTGVDWNKEISNSIININVNVKVKESKRIQY